MYQPTIIRRTKSVFIFKCAQSYVALLNDPLPAMTFAIYQEEEVVGFIMIHRDSSEENEYGNEAAYGILRLMIDKN